MKALCGYLIFILLFVAIGQVDASVPLGATVKGPLASTICMAACKVMISM